MSFEPVDDVEEALLVLAHEVAAVEPAAGERRRRSPPRSRSSRASPSARGRRSRRPRRGARRRPSSSTIRTSTLIAGCPTEPILRTASAPLQERGVGRHLGLAEGVDDLDRGEGPRQQLERRQRRLRGAPHRHPQPRRVERRRPRDGCRSPATGSGRRSRSRRRARPSARSSATGSKPVEGSITPSAPRCRNGSKPVEAADVEQRQAREPDVARARRRPRTASSSC